uniref:protein max isoform X1 n=1 Tax=Pristiophorus japonicus TaxID=55135 RepID=UPI00398E56DE
MISRSKVTRTKEHTTTHWSANAGITSKTAFIVYVTPYHHSRVKSNKAREVSGNNTDERQNNAASLSNPGKTLVVWRQLYKASRAQILDKATEYIQYMRRKNHTHQQDIDDLKRQNTLLEQQVRALEKARAAAQLQANFSSSDSSLYTNPKGSAVSAFDGGSDSTSESETEEPQTRKKLRMEAS